LLKNIDTASDLYTFVSELVGSYAKSPAHILKIYSGLWRYSANFTLHCVKPLSYRHSVAPQTAIVVVASCVVLLQIDTGLRLKSRVGTKTLFSLFVKTKTFTKSVTVFVKFRLFYAKGFCEKFLRKS
jgi:hypothetical protein